MNDWALCTWTISDTCQLMDKKSCISRGPVPVQEICHFSPITNRNAHLLQKAYRAGPTPGDAVWTPWVASSVDHRIIPCWQQHYGRWKTLQLGAPNPTTPSLSSFHLQGGAVSQLIKCTKDLLGGEQPPGCHCWESKF